MNKVGIFAENMYFMGLAGLLLSLSGFFGFFVSLKFILINHFRIPKSIAKLLYKQISNSNFKFVMEEELVFDKKDPSIYKSLVKLDGVYVLFDRSERLFTAGWQSKEGLTDIYFFRWNTQRVRHILDAISKIKKEVSVYAMSPYGNSHIGTVDCKEFSIVLDKEIYEDIENDVSRVIKGELSKTSALLYGPPGNGKSRFIRYISQKYELPIYTFYFNPDYTNLDILEAFAMIPKHSIVLFEDFDNYFDDRTCLIKSENVKFTFDVLLNCLDGVYNDYKKTIFFMTVNDLGKVSDALKKRPSRFKYVREFKNPSTELKLELLGNEELAEGLVDISLDQTFKIKDFISMKGLITLNDAKELIN